jgi:hypothetical protein
LFVATGTVLSGQFDWGDLLPKGNKFIVALPAGDGGASIRLYAGTSENPALLFARRVTTRRVRTISRKDRERSRYPQRLHAERLAVTRETMIQSVLYGDIERPAEMHRPPTDHPHDLARVRAGRVSESE